MALRLPRASVTIHLQEVPMNRIVCLTLPTLMVLGCGSDAGSPPDARVADAGRDVSADGPAPDAPGAPDVGVGRDLSVVPDAPGEQDLPLDGPMPDTWPPFLLDAAYDAPPANVDGPISDGSSTIDMPPGQPSDGAVEDSGTKDAMMLRWPDGRVLTAVEECQRSTVPDSARCPATYAEGLAKAQTVDASFSVGTAAGRCSEGSYVYYPYYSTSSVFCYYDASTQQLIGTVLVSDVFEQCQMSGDTASRFFVYGTRPPCTNMKWEVYRPPY
jgi:hypothetical protein